MDAVTLKKLQLLVNGQTGANLFEKIPEHDGGTSLVVLRVQTTAVVNQCLEASEAPLPLYWGAGFLAEEIQHLERGNFVQVILQNCSALGLGGMLCHHLDDALQDLCGLVVEPLGPHLL